MHKIAINTRVNTWQIKRMDMEFSNTLIEVYTMDSSEMIQKIDTDA